VLTSRIVTPPACPVLDQRAQRAMAVAVPGQEPQTRSIAVVMRDPGHAAVAEVGADEFDPGDLAFGETTRADQRAADREVQNAGAHPGMADRSQPDLKIARIGDTWGTARVADRELLGRGGSPAVPSVTVRLRSETSR
jgi:hypothetical protein